MNAASPAPGCLPGHRNHILFVFRHLGLIFSSVEEIITALMITVVRRTKWLSSCEGIQENARCIMSIY